MAVERFSPKFVFDHLPGLHLPKKTKLAVPGLLLAAVVGCGAAITPSNSASPDQGSFSPVPTGTATPEPTWPPIVFPPTFTTTNRPVPTANPKDPCDPRRVPDAKTVVPINSELPSTTLHVPVLEYHRIIDGSDSLKVPPAVFEAQMKILYDNGWQTITMAELAYDWINHITPSPKTFVITFDDGYEDGYLNAFPILQKYGYVAIFFVVSTRVTHSPSYPENLTAGELFKLVQAGNEIGNHTYGHYKGITKDNAGPQVYVAEDALAEFTGVYPADFAYPFGDKWDYEDAVASCKTIVFAVVQQPDPNVPQAIENRDDRLGVPRVKIFPGTTPPWLLYMLNHLNQYLGPKPTASPSPTASPTESPTASPTQSAEPSPTAAPTPAPPTPEPSTAYSPYSPAVIALDARRRIIEDYGEELPKVA